MKPEVLGAATLYLGDVLVGLAQLDDESVHTCITSPPYWGLRDYGHDGQIGLEPTLGEYVDRMVHVFEEVRRVLRADGTCWINLGDAYRTRPNGGVGRNSTINGTGTHAAYRAAQACRGRKRPAETELKHKDLIGIPWRVALALQEAGWYLRQDIIWHKKNPMPESVRDRCTKAHEYLFLLSKSRRYYFDQDAIKEPAGAAEPNSPHSIKSPHGQGYSRRAKVPAGWDTGPGSHRELTGRYRRSGNKERKYGAERGLPTDSDCLPGGHLAGSVPWEGYTRNKRSVWTVPTSPFPEAHFATFPPDLIRPCVLAGSPAGGVVLDPFAGSGTTGEVALEHGRRFVGIELNPAYMAMIRRRVIDAQQQGRLFA